MLQGSLEGSLMAGKVFVGPGEVFRERFGEINNINTTNSSGFQLAEFAASKRPYVMQIVLLFVNPMGLEADGANQGIQGSAVASFWFFDAFGSESGYERKTELILK
jgi:hypothetical protein